MSHLHHRISELIDDELHGAARRRALAHARVCGDCRHELKVMLALKARMSGLANGDPSPDLVCVLSSVAEETVDKTSPLTAARSRLVPVLRRLVVTAGSLSVAVLSVAYVVGGPSDGAVAQVSPPVDEYAADFAGNTGLAPLSDPPVGAMDGDQDVDLRPAALVTYGRAATSLPRSAAQPSPADQAVAVEDLRRAVAAPDLYSYDGTQVIETFGPADTSRIDVDVDHVPGQGTTFAFGGADGYSDATFLPDRDQAPGSSLEADVGLLAQAYDVAVVGSASILGRPATVIAASRRGQLDARFWIDDATGLLVRREMYDDGVLVRSTGFTELSVRRDGFLTHMPPELEEPAVSPVSMMSAAALNDAGWMCPGQLWGAFELTGLEHVDIAGDVMRANYTDGLSTISMFEQRGSLDPSAVSGLDKTSVDGSTVYVSYGLPTVAVWASDGTVYTVVTDATRDVATAVVAGLPHLRPAREGLGDRLHNGLDRMGSSLHVADWL